jgi:hypothetical protein
MANFQQFSGDLTAAFNVGNASQALIAQQKATSSEMIAQVERFNNTRMEMDAARAKVGGILSSYPTDDSGKPDISAPKYVHDAYNAVNKEGGLQQMSASQLNAVMTGYQTGMQVTQQRLQEMQTQRAIRQEEEQMRIDDAWRRTQEERNKVATEETKTTSVKTGTKEVASYDLSNAQGWGSLVSDTVQSVAKDGVLKSLLKVKSTDANVGEIVKKAGQYLGEKIQVAEAEAQDKEFAQRKAQADTSAAMQASSAKRNELSRQLVELQAEKNRIKQEYGKPIQVVYGVSGPGGIPVSQNVPLTAEQIQQQNNRLTAIDIETKRIQEEFSIDEKSMAPVYERRAGKVPQLNATLRVTQDTYETEQKTVQRSQELMLTDEYNIVTNHLKATGSLPSSWNRSAFMQMKGYPNIQQVEIPGVGQYVSINGKGELIKSKDLQGDIGDQLKIRDATILAQQRSLNGTELAGGTGYRFTGEIRSSDIKDVNKVRMELGTSSNALANVDTLLRVAEDASLIDKLVPGEITGLAGSISNAIQAASRTEIGGSGAWSEQDQIRIDKIVRDPTSLKNMAFRQETIASIKAYRQRLLDGMNRSGSVYGFRMSGTPADARNAEARISRLRIAYQTAIASGKSQQEALLIARDSVGMSQ